MCSNTASENKDLDAVCTLNPQDDVDQRCDARESPAAPESKPRTAEQEVPSKKRKTRRGRNKRRHPYLNRARKSSNVIKPEAPHNSNQFLIEDQGINKEIDEELRNDRVITRTRDSSFSMDSDGEFYSSPEDEEMYLRKDFDDTYENLRAERLNQMSKNELIQEFLLLEKRVDFLNKRVRTRFGDVDIDGDDDVSDPRPSADNSEEFQREIDHLKIEIESLRRENSALRNQLPTSNTDSKDSESDSSDSCSSCSSSSSESAKDESILSASPQEAAPVDYSQTNGHSPVSPSNPQPV